MPPTAATPFALSRCLRSQRTLAACMQNTTASSFTRTCSAGAICPTRTIFTSRSAQLVSSRHTTSAPSRIHVRSSLSRKYIPISSKRHSSSVQGTIAEGEAGISQEAEILQAPEQLNDKEKEIWTMLYKELQPTKLEVQDISGGCGSMYGIEIVSEKFRGLNMLKQQRLVNSVLGEEIKGWHGVQLKTAVP